MSNHVYEMSMNDIEKSIQSQPLSSVFMFRQLGVNISPSVEYDLKYRIQNKQIIYPYFLNEGMSDEIVMCSVLLFKMLYHLHSTHMISSFIQNNYLVQNSQPIHMLYYVICHADNVFTSIQFENQVYHKLPREHRVVSNQELQQSVNVIGQPFLNRGETIQQTMFDLFGDGNRHYVIWYTPNVNEMLPPRFPIFYPV